MRLRCSLRSVRAGEAQYVRMFLLMSDRHCHLVSMVLTRTLNLCVWDTSRGTRPSARDTRPSARDTRASLGPGHASLGPGHASLRPGHASLGRDMRPSGRDTEVGTCVPRAGTRPVDHSEKKSPSTWQRPQTQRKIAVDACASRGNTFLHAAHVPTTAAVREYPHPRSWTTLVPELPTACVWPRHSTRGS